jgi:hypothetical protein
VQGQGEACGLPDTIERIEMKSAIIVLGVGLILASGSSALGQPAPAAAPAAATAEATAATDDPVICKASKQTGTRLRTHKVCLKRSEWVAKSKSRTNRNELEYGDGCGGAGGCIEQNPRPSGGGL